MPAKAVNVKGKLLLFLFNVVSLRHKISRFSQESGHFSFSQATLYLYVIKTAGTDSSGEIYKRRNGKEVNERQGSYYIDQG